MLCPLQAMDVLKLLASVDVRVCHSDIKASLCTFPFPAESQASSSSLATGGSPPLSPLSFLLVFMPWSAWRGGSWRCEVAPTSTDLLSDAEDVQLLGSLEIPWLLCGLPVCLPGWANNTGKGTVQEAGGQQKASHSRVCKKPK